MSIGATGRVYKSFPMYACKLHNVNLVLCITFKMWFLVNFNILAVSALLLRVLNLGISQFCIYGVRLKIQALQGKKSLHPYLLHLTPPAKFVGSVLAQIFKAASLHHPWTLLTVHILTLYSNVCDVSVTHQRCVLTKHNTS